jgi:type II secretory pathway pseudopilin PulG
MLILWKNNKKGASVIEILIAIAIVGIAFGSILGLATLSLKSSIAIKETTKANALAQEAMEALRNFRDGIAWDNDDPLNEYDGLGVVIADTSYHLEKSTDTPSKWMLIQGEETINGFTRKVVFNDVYRDIVTDDINTGGYLDDGTKKVTVTVSWKDRKVEIITYLTNWKE